MSKTPKQRLRRAAIYLIQRDGIANVEKTDVCARAGLFLGSFRHHTGGSYADFMRALLDEGHIGPPVPITRKRVDPEIMAAHILNVAVPLAEATGYRNVALTELSVAAGVSRQTVINTFATSKILQNAIMEYAVTHETYSIIAQGLALNDPIATGAAQRLRRAALKQLKAATT